MLAMRCSLCTLNPRIGPLNLFAKQCNSIEVLVLAGVVLVEETSITLSIIDIVDVEAMVLVDVDVDVAVTHSSWWM